MRPWAFLFRIYTLLSLKIIGSSLSVKYVEWSLPCEDQGLDSKLYGFESCDKKCFFKDTQPFFYISRKPYLDQCPNMLGVEMAFRDDSGKKEKFLDVLGSYHFCFCIDVHFETKVKDTTTSKEVWIAARKLSNGSLNIFNLFEINPTIWDLRNDCYKRWYYSLTDSPLGIQSNSILTSGSSQDCSKLWSHPSYNDDVHEYVDIFYRQSILVQDIIDCSLYHCLESLFHRRHSCTEQCLILDYDIAFVRSDMCACGYFSGPFQTSQLKASRCLDLPWLSCGLERLSSAFVVKQLDTFGFKFWQCAYSDAESGIFDNAGELILESTTDTVIECFRLCHESGGFDIVSFSHLEMSSKVSCRCLWSSFIRYRSEDVGNAECFSFWCPDIKGPCSKDHKIRTIYCRGSRCDHRLLLPIGTRSMCPITPLYQVDPKDISKSQNFLCETSPTGWTWSKVKCSNVILNPRVSCIKQTTKPLINYCDAIDGRNHRWTVRRCITGIAACSNDPENESLAYWTCGSNTQFETEEPDRTECMDDWIDKLKKKIYEDTEKSLTLSTELKTYAQSSKLLAGSLLKFPEMLKSLSYQHFNENNTQYERIEYSGNIYNTINSLLGQELGWNEIHNDTLKYSTASDIIDYIDLTGYSLLEGTIDHKYCDFNQGYDFQNFLVNVSKYSLNKMRTLSWTFQGVDAKITMSLEENIFSKDCMKAVGYTLLKPNSSSLFSQFQGPVILGFSIEEEWPSGKTVKISFQNPKYNRVQKCVFWDRTALNWSSTGCRIVNEYGPEVSCICNHLTSFGILFGSKVTNDSFTDLLSLILGICSCVILLLTQVFLHRDKTIQRPRYTIEINRNYCLILGQITFLTVVGFKPLYTTLECKIVALWSQYIWLCVFVWFWLEGRLLHQVLIVVFNTVQWNILDLYLVGYGLPLICVILTLITGVVLQDDDEFIRSDSCWLGEKYVWGFLVPVLTILLSNFYILIKGVIITYQYCRKKKHSRSRKIISWIRSGITLSYLLGVPWIFGYLTRLDETFEYIYIFMASSTGFFIFLYSVGVAEIAKRLFPKNPSTRSTSLASKRHGQ